MLALSGNDKMNSLFEFQIETARDFLLSQGIDAYIRHKYLLKSFVNAEELDLTVNYHDELSKNLYKNVCTPCVSLTIYYSFLGVDMHTVDETGRTLRDLALESDQNTQAFYLELNECFLTRHEAAPSQLKTKKSAENSSKK